MFCVLNDICLLLILIKRNKLTLNSSFGDLCSTVLCVFMCIHAFWFSLVLFCVFANC